MCCPSPPPHTRESSQRSSSSPFQTNYSQSISIATPTAPATIATTLATQNPISLSPSLPPSPPLPSQSSIFFVVASVELRGDGTPLSEAMSDGARVTGSVYALRFVLDLQLRAPLHWGPLFLDDLFSRWRDGMSRLRQTFATSLTTRPTEELSKPTAPQATPAPRQSDVSACIPSPQAVA